MMQLDRDMARERFGFQMNPLIVAAMIGVLHDVAGRFVDRQFERSRAIFVQRRTRKTAAEGAHEFARLPKFLEIARDIHLPAVPSAAVFLRTRIATLVRSSVSRSDPGKRRRLGEWLPPMPQARVGRSHHTFLQPLHAQTVLRPGFALR